MIPTTARNILISLLLFLGLSAMAGGSLLIISPSGKLLGGLPLSILEHSPFSDFLIPGLILLLILGVFPCLISFALIRKPINRVAQYFNFFKDMHWAWSFSIYVAFALIIWIQVETIFAQGVGWLQTFYMLICNPNNFCRTASASQNYLQKMRNRKIMIIALSIFGLLAITLIFARINSSVQFSKKVKELFGQSKSISDQTFQKNRFVNLPEPVQRYFNHILKDGEPYISYARITHDGQFRTGLNKDWINIQGEQYATTEKPGFIWKGTTLMFTARDMYIGGKGRLAVSLFSLFPVVNAAGDHYNQGELLRWLGESILYPTNLLPSERIQWFAINSQSAKLTFHYNGFSLFFIVTFNEIGEIVQMETKRYMDETNLEPWVIKCANYKEFNNVLVPSTFEVLWRLEKGDFSYAKFNMKKIEYNNPNLF